MAEGRVWIKRGREKPIRNRHPWIYSGAISQAEKAADGDLVRVVDHKGRFLARGYWNSQSQIQARILSWRDEAIDEAWWRRALSRAASLRATRCVDNGVDSENAAYRLLNAENDFAPGLIIDRYADWYVLQALTRYIDNQKPAIVTALADVTGARNIYERSDVEARKREGLQPAVGLLKGGPLPDVVEIDEEARFLVDIQRGQKTGFYLDQRDNRRLLGELVRRRCEESRDQAQLLNVFSYSGGFALAAGNFDRLHSVNVDASRPALELAERNFQLNGYDESAYGETVEFIQADAFDYLRHCARERELFDFVVLDPPKLAQRKSQAQRAARGYKDLNLSAFKLVKAGGYLMSFSCSGAVSRELFRKIVFGALADSGRGAQVIGQLSAAADHPVALSFPEGDYLKGLLLRVF